MAQADIERLCRGYEAFSRGEWDSAISDAHPDFELQTAERFTSPGTYRGVDQALRMFEDMFAPFEEVNVEPREIFDLGEQIAVILRVRTRPKGSTAAIENTVGHLWTVRDGKFARLQVFPEYRKLLELVEASA